MCFKGGEWDTKTGSTGDFSKGKMFGMENDEGNRPKGQRQRDHLMHGPRALYNVLFINYSFTFIL